MATNCLQSLPLLWLGFKRAFPEGLLKLTLALLKHPGQYTHPPECKYYKSQFKNVKFICIGKPRDKSYSLISFIYNSNRNRWWNYREMTMENKLLTSLKQREDETLKKERHTFGELPSSIAHSLVP